MSSQRQKFFFTLIFLAVFLPNAWTAFSRFSVSGSVDYWGLLGHLSMAGVTAALLATVVVLRLSKSASSQPLINVVSTDLSKNPLAPSATFRIDKTGAGGLGNIRLDGEVTKGVLQKGMGFKISDDSGIIITFLTKPEATGYNRFLAQVGSEDGSLIVLARPFGRTPQSFFSGNAEIEFSDTSEFRAQAVQPLSLNIPMSILLGASGLLVAMLLLSVLKPDDFHRLVSLFQH